MLVGGPPSLTSDNPKKPSVFHIRERRNADEISEGAEARLRKIVTRKLEEVLRDRGRSRDQRQTSSVRDEVTQKEPTPTQGSQESRGFAPPAPTEAEGPTRTPARVEPGPCL